MKHKQLQMLQYPLWYYYVGPCVLALVTILFYMPSLHYAFQFDDVANIQKHFQIRNYTLASLFFTGSRWISYWLNAIHYSIGKFDPFSYRVGNVIIHCLNGMLVFNLITSSLARIAKNVFFKEHHLTIGLLTCALFLLHPVQTQTVSYVIQGELEGLAMLFSLTVIACFLRATTKGASTLSTLFYNLMMLIIAFLACGTKEITIVLPALLLLVDWFFVAQGKASSLKQRAIIHMLVAGIMISTYIHLLRPRFFADLFGLKMAVNNNIGNIITPLPGQPITPLIFLLSQFKVILHYIWIFIWPRNISVEYDWILTRGFFAPDCIIPLIMLISIAALLFALLKRNTSSPIGFGILWFFMCILPRSSIMPSPELIVDYKTYLGSIGLLFILASGITYGLITATRYLDQLRKHLVLLQGACICIFACSLGYATYERNKVWSSGIAFWQNVMDNAPGKARAYNNYGVELSQNLGKYAEAIPYFKKAMSMDDHYSDPCNNVAVAYARTNDIPAAIEAVKKSLLINKFYPEGYNNLASFFLQQGDINNAELYLGQALQLRPHYGKAYYNLGRVYALRGNQEKAWECFKRACTKADFDTEVGFSTYAQASLALHKYDDAILGYTKVLEIVPCHVSATFYLASAYFFKGDYEHALTCYEKSLTYNPQDEKVLFNLGETCLKLGHTQRALSYYERVPLNKFNGAQLLAGRLVDCYTALGKTEQAAEVIARAKNLAPVAQVT